MGEMSLQDALVQVASSSAKDRTSGLNDLIHILKHNRNSNRLNSIKDDAYHALCETLFQCAIYDRSLYLHGKTSSRTSRAPTAPSRLSLCANALRLTIEARVRMLKKKTVDAVLDHIARTLRIKGQGLVEPLLLDYLKAMRAILAYQPHVEQLSKQDWDNAVDFCLKAIPFVISDPDTGSSLQSNGYSSGRATNISTDKTSRSGTREPSNRDRPLPDTSKYAVEELVFCLHLLASASNAPLLDKSEQILSMLIELLHKNSVKTLHSTVFAAINSVLMRIALDSTQLTKQAIRDLLPIIKSLWSDAVLRSEMLVTLIHTKEHLSSLLKSSNEESTQIDLEFLVESMHAAYSKRQERQLQDDDLCFRYTSRSSRTSHPLNTSAFSLRTGNVHSESFWMTVFLVSHFSSILDARKRMNWHDRVNGDEMPSKRPRICQHFHEYLRQVFLDSPLSTKIAALQIVAFMVQETPMDEEDIQLVLEKLTACISDENTTISVWAMIGLAATAFQRLSNTPELEAYWSVAWQSASRAVTSASSCRAACHLMDVILKLKLIPYESISESAEGMLSSIELNGPALLADSCSSLWTTLIRLRNAENPSFFGQTSDRVLHWFFSKWSPSLFPERSYTSQNSQHCDAQDVLRLIYACLDRPPLILEGSPFMVLGSVAQAWLHTRYYWEISQYLLLSDDAVQFQAEPEGEYIATDSDSSRTGRRCISSEAKVIDFCISELEKTRQRWKEWTTEYPQNITPDMIRVVANLCIISSALASIGDSTNSHRLNKLEIVLDSIIMNFTGFLSRRDCEQYKVDAVLEVCARNLINIHQLYSLNQQSFKESGVLRLSTELSKALEDRRLSKDSFHATDDDFMETDNGANSQMINGAFNPDIDVPRHDLIARTNVASLRASCSVYMHLISCTSEFQPEEQDGSIIPPAFVDYLTSISTSDLLHCRQFVSTLILGRMRLSKESCQALLDRMIRDFLQTREYKSSEVANGMIIEVMIGSAPLWTDPDTTDPEARKLYDTTADMYEWFVERVQQNSINLQIGITNLFHCLLKIRPDYAGGISLPSVRTSLFGLLANSDIAVKYHITEHLPDMFNDFILSRHDMIFEDVHTSLPNKSDWIEGIAIRLLVLSRLASTWHTLLRRCIYHVFETAGLVAHAVGHATRCVSNISKAMNLESPQALFRIFASQIVFTWLNSAKKVIDIPFSAFNYSSLVELLKNVEAEAVGQAIMLGDVDELDFIADRLKVPIKEALKKNFAKAAAYSISWDTCKGSGRNKSVSSNDARLRSYLGSDQYVQLMHSHFPRIVGFILQTMVDEERFDKAASKRPAFEQTTKALEEIKAISYSGNTLPQGIEPSFTAKYLLDQIERLCRRIGYDPVKFWTANIFVFVMRMMLDRIHPALGSLHACSIIRKIRILVSLAGDIAFSDYPLQMTLQSLRPFLTDSQCAEDTLGIMRYLFEHGKTSLSSHLSFTTGISLSILISLRVFLGTSQESTTQESQYLATMNKAQSFHSWFITYLETYSGSISGKALSSPHMKAFKSIVAAASEIRTEGNAVRGTAESKLLLELLDDDRSGRKLLSTPSREVAFNLLCQQFQPPASTHDDILGSDEQAVLFAPQVWQSCGRNGISDGYLLWAARVLGRTFSARGELQHMLRKLSRKTHSAYTLRGSGVRGSKTAIVQSLSDLLLSDNRDEVGLAEEAIRLILSRLMLSKGPTDDELAEVEQMLPDYVVPALALPIPDDSGGLKAEPKETIRSTAMPERRKHLSTWIRDLTIFLAHIGSQDAILGSLTRILLRIDGFAERLFPYIFHLVLSQEFDGPRPVREAMSEAYHSWFEECGSMSTPYVRILMRAILYLRTQPIPREVTRVDRDRWLDLDYLKASEAAAKCNMYQIALLFAETYSAMPALRSPRRSSAVTKPKLPTSLQFEIYRNLDEPDSFYGVEREPSLSSVLDRLDYESNGAKSLLFRGALMDSQMRQSKSISPADSRGIVKSLIMLNLNSVTHLLLSNDHFHEAGNEIVSSALYTARKLEQWDIKAPESNNDEASTIFRAFQGLHYSPSTLSARKHLDREFLATMRSFVGRGKYSQRMKASLRALAVLTELDEIISSSDPDQVHEAWAQMQSRQQWMQGGQFEDVQLLLSCRETLFSILSSNSQLQNCLRTKTRDIRHMEVGALLSSSVIFRKHGALQESLASATYLSEIVEKCKAVGLNIDAAAQYEVASALWEQGEASTSIRMRQELMEKVDLSGQSSSISISVLLAKLGHHMAEARLEKPEEIIKDYLIPSIRELKDQTQGREAGQVFHEFASFCDKQLQNPDAIEDMARMKSLMERKAQEAHEYERLSKAAKSSREREGYRSASKRSKKWYELDAEEFQRLRRGREEFLRQSLENYLLSLQASNDYNSDVLRVFSLWLEFSETPLANNAVRLYLSKVPSGKFAILMNQLSSRLQAEKSDFQSLLFELVFQICVDHPYHGMHQIYAGAMPLAVKDDAAKSRNTAAKHIAQMLKNDQRARPYWHAIHESNTCYHELALTKGEDYKTGREQLLEKNSVSKKLMQKVPGLKVPPATMTIDIRADCDYSDVPKITGFRPRMTIANGLSAPKIITALASDGLPYKQLFKSGNDDLRQDAIMEQVFEQVSRLLKNHTATRLRDLHIRTYKVLPLSARSGLMEFVPNTIPLHSYLMPAHERYYPKDWKSELCRKEISQVSTESNEVRIKKWKQVAEHFTPVMRYFFLERFEDPNEWFEKRLAYTRTTAAISILGHVLGLGDRHCHNILLDEKSGEVVHIDLGVAFEAGRVLPVPEVVPFRLTRDLVDAMGYTRTEGVFRRCCEFTMDTLREERESIMTLLNVLRYDPLVNWSLSPLKAKRMQEGQGTGQDGTRGAGAGPALDEIVDQSSKKKEDEAGEAGRALSVVEKKLAKTLSTTATVNELIQQATDERNLAVLYSGWAAYA